MPPLMRYAAEPLAPGLRELVGGVVVVLVLSRFVNGPAAWAVSALVLVAVLLGARELLGAPELVDADSEAGAASTRRGIRWPSVPIEAALDPAVLALGSVGVLRLVPIGLLEVPLLALMGWLLLRDLRLEGRLAAATTAASAADRTAVLAMTIAAGLAAFGGIAALVPGGLAAPGADVVTTPALVLGLAAVDGLVAFLLAYRVAALRSSNLRDIGWAASGGAAVVAIAAAALRALEIPGVLAPALLVLVLFLWEAMHGGPARRRRDTRRIWETGLLVALGLVVVAWSLGLRS